MTTQQAAHDELEAAIDHFLQEVGHDGLLQDWVLVTNSLVLVDGHEKHHTDWTSSQPQALYRTFGLVSYAAARIKTRITARGEE